MSAYELRLPSGEWAEAEDLDGLALAARTLVTEGERLGSPSAFLRRGLYALRDGVYDGPATAWLRGDRDRPTNARGDR